MKERKTAALVGLLTVCIGVGAFAGGIDVSAQLSGATHRDDKEYLGEAKVNEGDETFQESKTIWVIGDSISSDHDIDPANEVQITGWGNVLLQFVPDDVTIVNKARSGRSSKSYTTEQVYKEVMRTFQSGDYMIIQFGHNDEKEAPRYTDPQGDSATEGSYKFYLKTMFIDPVLQKGGRVILASSVVRHLFDGEKLSEQTHGVYAEAMKELAKECQQEGKEVYFIDTFQFTKDLYESLGEEETNKLHAVIGTGEAAELDDTHYSPYGAVYMANVIGKQLKMLGISCLQEGMQNAWLIEDDETLLKQARELTTADKFKWAAE